jgi:hypothetical protein
VILQTVLLEGKGGGPVSSFVSKVISYRISGNMTGTDMDGTEIDSGLLVSFVLRTGLSFIYFWQIMEKFSKRCRSLIDYLVLFVAILTK